MDARTHATIDFEPEAAPSVRIVLVGFMGAGKTSLARRWSESSGPVLWFDSDRAVLHELGCATVTEAFEQHGEDGFRAVERQVILDRGYPLARGVEVWSLGGGALQHEDVRALLDDACVVWLDADPEVLWDRVAGSDRPLARDRSAFLERYAERHATYEAAATVRVDATRSLDELGLGRVLAEHLPPSWFGSGIAVGEGLVERIEDLAATCDGRPIALVADRAVGAVADAVRARLDRAGRVVLSDVRLPMGEFNKQMSTVEYLLRAWAEAALTRDAIVVALGGGTLLDTTGFAASVFLRGVDWVSIPTTLTSQVDAGIGGKTGVNLGVAKNVVGSVHMPRATIIDPSVLTTLGLDEVRDGFVEAAKTAMLAGHWLLDRARAVADAPAGSRDSQWRDLVEGCAGFKDAVVAEDPFDTDGIRAQLNLGHTLAHTIEAATGGAVSHGAAVAIGTHVALRLSELVLDAPHGLVETWNELCTQFGIVTRSPLAWEQLEPFLKLDKKRDRHGIGWVLLDDVGAPVTGVRLPVEAAQRVWNEHVHVPRPESTLPLAAEVASSRHPRVLVLFGVNLGQLGSREAEHYGTQTLPELVHDIESWASAEGLVADCRQTDSLERFVHALHEARLRHHAVIVNPGAWTHYERSIHDALAPLDLPRVEVHLSDIDARAADAPDEHWRATSVIRPVVDHHVSGQGAEGYREALRWVREQL
ncbi:MAG: iron-containing alcohol dehydrogenase [Thermoleophilia bacterium]|nr:iron-containing alcohol dehydrogenase [Thermoleophilia bacterium]